MSGPPILNNGLCTRYGCTEPRGGNGRLCRPHYNEEARAYRKRTPGLERARANRYYAGPGKHRVRELKYGLNKEEVEALLETQGGVCAICKTPEPGGRFNEWALDHDHKTNKPRGPLCNQCNHGLGSFRDNTVFLESAVAYLRRACSAQSSVQRALALSRSRDNYRMGSL